MKYAKNGTRTKKNGKYVTLFLTNEEHEAFTKIQESINSHGWKVPLTAIVKKAMMHGTDNMNMEEIAKNPIKFIMEDLICD